MVEEQKLEEENLEEWTTAYINDLPDSAFLYIAPGGKKDEEGKTVPRSLRKLPYKDKDGNIDLPHLRNAIARLSQEKTDIPESTKKKLLAKARKILERETKKRENMSADDIDEDSDDESSEDDKMENDKEKLGAENIEEAEEAKVEDEKVVDKEEPKPEEGEKEPEEVKEDADKKEKLESEIQATEKELNFLKEAKEQLISLYANNKELKDKIEKLSKENEELKNKYEQLNAEFVKVKEVKEQLEKKINRDRLEKLSEKFSILGQDKSVEELEQLDKDVLEEFEKIVDSAIEKLSEDSVAPSVVKQPTEKPAEEPKNEVKKEEPVKKEEAKISDEDFFKNVMKTISKSNKRVFEL